MELNWSTFVLEVINFLVLVWILKRFLYRPILNVIAERRRSVEEELAKARTTESEADALKQQYAGRLEAWEAEKSKAKEQLAREIEQERARKLSELTAALEQEKEKARVAEQRQQAEKERALAQQALKQGAIFSSRLLELAAGPELESRLLGLVIEGLSDLPDEKRRRLSDQWREPSPVAEIRSAFDLSPDQREQLTEKLKELAKVADVRFRRDESLIAGLRIEVGAWVLAANVRDELKGFTELLSAPD
jgi:F-type H+-transporting ATPase subunit b